MNEKLPLKITYYVSAYDESGYGENCSKDFGTGQEAEAVAYAKSLEARMGAHVYKKISMNDVMIKIFPNAEEPIHLENRAWFIMRLDLPMTQGKFGVQIGHGTDFIHMIGYKNPFYENWIDPACGNRRKIVLKAKTLSDIEKLKVICDGHGMITKMIEDRGLTEFDGPTITGMVILPHNNDIPTALKRTQVWKSTDG